MTTDRDISWNGSGGTFNLRVAAIITHNEMILLCRLEKYWFCLAAGFVSVRRAARRRPASSPKNSGIS